MNKESISEGKKSRPREEARFNREAEALRKNLEKRKKQQEERQKLKHLRDSEVQNS